MGGAGKWRQLYSKVNKKMIKKRKHPKSHWQHDEHLPLASGFCRVHRGWAGDSTLQPPHSRTQGDGAAPTRTSACDRRWRQNVLSEVAQQLPLIFLVKPSPLVLPKFTQVRRFLPGGQRRRSSQTPATPISQPKVQPPGPGP